MKFENIDRMHMFFHTKHNIQSIINYIIIFILGMKFQRLLLGQFVRNLATTVQLTALILNMSHI